MSGLVKLRQSPALIFVLLAILSLPLRLAHLDAPITGDHEFRQTQTALSVWEIRERGASLLHPKLPLFGPPWECPFEYPIFQLVAAGVDAIAPWKNLDASVRVTNVIFYYLTAGTLFLLARLLFAQTGVALFSSALFLFSPYHLVWSRSTMIEYAATFFALAFLLTFIRWTFKPGVGLFVLCVGLGILGCLTKITTFVVPFFVCGILTGLYVLRLLWRGRHEAVGDDASKTKTAPISEAGPATKSQGELGLLHIGLMICLLLVPVAVGYSYVKLSDKIKEASPYTAWLSSNNPYMKAWNYGTPGQRLSLDKWSITLHRLAEIVMPWLAVALILGFGMLPFKLRGFEKLPGKNFWIGCALALALLVPIVLFYNLYWIHTYYFIACSALVCLLAGLGLSVVYNFIKDLRVRILLVVLLIAMWFQAAWPTIAGIVTTPVIDPRVTYLTEASKVIPKNDPVIILTPRDWSAVAPYYLKRRAFMAYLAGKPVDLKPLMETDYFKENGFHWLLVEGKHPSVTEPAAKIMARWKNARVVSIPASGAHYVLYSLSDN